MQHIAYIPVRRLLSFLFIYYYFFIFLPPAYWTHTPYGWRPDRVTGPVSWGGINSVLLTTQDWYSFYRYRMNERLIESFLKQVANRIIFPQGGSDRWSFHKWFHLKLSLLRSSTVYHIRPRLALETAHWTAFGQSQILAVKIKYYMYHWRTQKRGKELVFQVQAFYRGWWISCLFYYPRWYPKSLTTRATGRNETVIFPNKFIVMSLCSKIMEKTTRQSMEKRSRFRINEKVIGWETLSLEESSHW